MKNTQKSTPPFADLPLTPERWTIIRPKLESLLAELAKMEAMESWELEPDTADAWGATTRMGPSGQNEVAGER